MPSKSESISTVARALLDKAILARSHAERKRRRALRDVSAQNHQAQQIPVTGGQILLVLVFEFLNKMHHHSLIKVFATYNEHILCLIMSQKWDQDVYRRLCFSLQKRRLRS